MTQKGKWRQNSAEPPVLNSMAQERVEDTGGWSHSTEDLKD